MRNEGCPISGAGADRVCYARAPMRRPRTRGWGAALVLCAVACDEPEPADGALLLATLDAHHFCDMDGVVGVHLRARWQACAATEPGCEAPPSPADAVMDGDRLTCPATDATRDLGVRLTLPGRYRIEAVAEHTAADDRVECFVDPDTGGTRIELPEDRLADESPVVLHEHGPCP